MVDVSGHHFHQVVVGTTHGVALDDVGLVSHVGMERLGGGVRLSFHGDLYERGDFQAELSLVDNGGITGDGTAVLELSDPPEGG